MTSQERAHIAIVLVRARNPANIGAVARAMHDFGYSDLRIVNEYPVPFASATSAVDASAVLLAAQEHADLGSALADCSFVFGTTAVGERNLRHRLYTIEDAGRVAGEMLANSCARVALLFGSEKTGLSNDELSYCDALLTIPMHQPEGTRHLSMNLGQAAAVCLYRLADTAVDALPDEEARAHGSDIDRVTGLLLDVMRAGGYSRRNPANAREPQVRRIVRRMNLTESDAAVWSGILRQTLFALGGAENFGRNAGPAASSDK